MAEVLFGNWAMKGVFWLVAAVVIKVLAVHWSALLAGLRGKIWRAFVAFLLTLLVAGFARWILIVLAFVVAEADTLVLVLQVAIAVVVQSFAMFLLYRAELSRALLASFLTSVLSVALLTPLTLLVV